MRKIGYRIAEGLLLVPFAIGFVIGFFWRGLKAGHFTGFNCLQNSTEGDLVEAVNKQVEKELEEGSKQTGLDIVNLLLNSEEQGQ